MEGFKESVENIAYVSVGPFGGERGKAWDDGIHTSVRQLIICSGSVINSIQIEYDDHGCSKWSKKHAESTEGGVTNVVKLEYPGEYLISLSGYYDVEGDHVVSSLTFLSNKQQCGPYGSGKGEYFSFPLRSGKIIGFHGRSYDHYLHSVGAYLEPYPSIFIGPFGGVNGREWDDGIYTTVRQLIIFYGSSVVESIQIEYDKNGHSKWSDRHGQAEGGTRITVKLDYPDEFLISISGYYSDDDCNPTVVRSLTIQSNRQQYGPYGIEQGKPFSTSSSSSSSSTQGKIVGFQGRSGLYLDSIGAYLKPFLCRSHSISIGPFGGSGGLAWDDGVYTTIRKLSIFSGSVIDAIKIEYDKNGHSKWSDKHGASPSRREDKVELDYPNEYIISISGRIGSDFGYNVIQSLVIESNRKKYGPFGTERGTPFNVPTTGGKVIGFHGRVGGNLDAIRVYVEPVLGPFHFISTGVFGGDGGDQWDDGAYTTIRQLTIFSDSVINSIQIEYDNKGRSEMSKKHGEIESGNKNTVQLDYPGEFLLSISGYCGTILGDVVVRSLTIESNKGTFGPFGVEEGNYFKFPSTDGKIIGFHGRSENYLVSIGAYFEPFPNP